MREYELTYLVSDEVLESDLSKITGKILAAVSVAEGKIKKEEIWGRRKLCYPIKKQDFANYVTLWLELPADKIVEINHELQVMPQILRHLLIAKTTGSEKLVVTKEDVVADEELEKVIGEKSVEVIKGETEESYGLMAKRESDKEIEDQKDEKIEEQKTEKAAKIQAEAPKPVVKAEARELEKETPVAEKEVAAPVVEVEEKTATEKVKKPAKPKVVPKAKKTDTEDEADRIKKLDEKLDELLGDDL